jgi:aspartate aminotransferase
MSRIAPSPTLLVLNRANDLIAQGVDVIDLGPGEPDFRTPSHIAAAGKEAIDRGFTRYTNAVGCSELRDEIAAYYNRRWATILTRENVIAGTGGKQELFNLALALVEAGDEVVIPSPYWVSFPDQVLFAGGKPVFARTDPAAGFRPTLEDIRRVFSDRTRAVVLNSPCNPTGAVISPAELEKIIRFCASRGAHVIFDETYELFTYDGAEHVSAMRWFDELPETVVAVNSMSKTFAMTGWRLGFALGHPDLISALGKIQSHSTSNPNSIAQWAAIEALRSGERDVRAMYGAYCERRAWLVPALNAIPGFQCPSPDGAFYVFPRVKELFGPNGVHDSTTLSSFFLEKAAVAVVPGAAFGSDDYIRISYATSMESLREGVRRLDSAVREFLAAGSRAAGE